jgi:hypothetical protein
MRGCAVPAWDDAISIADVFSSQSSDLVKPGTHLGGTRPALHSNSPPDEIKLPRHSPNAVLHRFDKLSNIAEGWLQQAFSSGAAPATLCRLSIFLWSHHDVFGV